MIPLPPLDCLRFFEAAARHRSFVRAAEELGVAPPAVAHRIRMLESHLGAELFERKRRGVYINRRGRACYEEVRRRRRGSGARSSAGSRRAPAHGTQNLSTSMACPR